MGVNVKMLKQSDDLDEKAKCCLKLESRTCRPCVILGQIRFDAAAFARRRDLPHKKLLSQPFLVHQHTRAPQTLLSFSLTPLDSAI